MGYSPPKCSCNGNHTNIQVNHAYPYLNVYMLVPCLESSPTPSHMPFVMYEKLFSKTKVFVLFLDNPPIFICGHTPIISHVENPPIHIVVDILR